MLRLSNSNARPLLFRYLLALDDQALLQGRPLGYVLVPAGSTVRVVPIHAGNDTHPSLGVLCKSGRFGGTDTSHAEDAKRCWTCRIVTLPRYLTQDAAHVKPPP